jgi:hypothetical protein
LGGGPVKGIRASSTQPLGGRVGLPFLTDRVPPDSEGFASRACHGRVLPRRRYNRLVALPRLSQKSTRSLGRRRDGYALKDWRPQTRIWRFGMRGKLPRVVKHTLGFGRCRSRADAASSNLTSTAASKRCQVGRRQFLQLFHLCYAVRARDRNDRDLACRDIGQDVGCVQHPDVQQNLVAG